MNSRVLSLSLAALCVAAFSTAGVVLAEERPDPDAARRARVYARIGERTITVGEIEDMLGAQSPALRRRYRDPERRAEFARGLVKMALLAREAERRGLGTRREVRDDGARHAVQQMIQRDIEPEVERASLGDDALRADYDARIEEYTRPARVSAAQILFESEEEANASMETIRSADLRAFRALAREKSVDTRTRLSGGELGWFDETGRAAGGGDVRVHQTVVRAAFGATEVGEVVGPFAVGERFCVLVLRGRREGETVPFERARGGIRQRLLRATLRDRVDEIINGRRAAQRPEIRTHLLEKIALDPPEPRPGLGDHHD